MAPSNALRTRSVRGPSRTLGLPAQYDDAYFGEHPEAFSQTPADIGAKGGNVGLVGGSVRRRSLREMKAWRASQLWDTQGALGLW